MWRSPEATKELLIVSKCFPIPAIGRKPRNGLEYHVVVVIYTHTVALEEDEEILRLQKNGRKH